MLRKSSFLLALGLLSLVLACATPIPSPENLFSGIDRTSHESVGKQFAIASQGPHTTRAAQSMFEKGGNIIDAAAAASFALAVERPQSTGLGGGGFMMIRWQKAKRAIAVDFRERAPRRATEKLFQDPQGNVIPKLSTEGALASATPGMVAGILEIHQRYGKLTRAQILEPAIHLAEEGFVVYPHLADAIQSQLEVLKRYPASLKVFTKSNGEPYHVGEIFKQPDLAKTLQKIAQEGRTGFYQGSVARAMVETHHSLGGLLTQEDLNTYSVKFRRPIRGTYGPYTIYSMPPSSSGGVHVIEMMNFLEGMQLQSPYSASSIHATASAMQQAFADRSKYLGDSDFVKVPLAGLSSKSYAAALRRSFDPARAKKMNEIKAGKPPGYHESMETTHFSMMDAEGNAVSSTQTVNGWLGSGVVVAGAGFLLNNEMDDFSAKPGVPNMFGVIGGKENAIQPGKRPLSSMSPTIVESKGKTILALGSPAGSRIITCVTLTLLNYLHYKMPLYEAVASLRYHHQWTPDEIEVEAPGFKAETRTELEKLGYKVQERGIGCKVQAVASEGLGIHAVSDPRDIGLAISDQQVQTQSTDLQRRKPGPSTKD